MYAGSLFKKFLVLPMSILLILIIFFTKEGQATPSWQHNTIKSILFFSCFRPEPDPGLLLQGGDIQDIKEPNVVLAFAW